MRRTLLCALGLLLALTILTTPAAALTCIAPPGTAAIDQYCETVPAAGGDRGSSDPPPTAQVPSKTVVRLGRAGPDGVALAQALGNPAPRSSGKPQPRQPTRRDSGSSGSGSGSGSAQKPTAVPSAPSSNPLSGVGQSIGSGLTIGPGFVVAFIVATLMMAGWGWIAYRRRSQ